MNSSTLEACLRRTTPKKLKAAVQQQQLGKGKNNRKFVPGRNTDQIRRAQSTPSQNK